MAKKRDSRKFKCKRERQAVLEGEALHKSTCITFDSQFNNPDRLLSPGGQCSCCGAGPRVTEPYDWCLIFRAGFNDCDGVFMSMLCGFPDQTGCYQDIKADADKRKPTMRDELADVAMMLMGEDLDGAESMMEDIGDMFGEFDE